MSTITIVKFSVLAIQLLVIANSSFWPQAYMQGNAVPSGLATSCHANISATKPIAFRDMMLNRLTKLPTGQLTTKIS